MQPARWFPDDIPSHQGNKWPGPLPVLMEVNRSWALRSLKFRLWQKLSWKLSFWRAIGINRTKCKYPPEVHRRFILGLTVGEVSCHCKASTPCQIASSSTGFPSSNPAPGSCPWGSSTRWPKYLGPCYPFAEEKGGATWMNLQSPDIVPDQL